MATVAEELAKAAVSDTFNRIENPLNNGGAWALLNPGKLTGQTSTVTNIGWRPTTTFAGGQDEAYWTAGTFSNAASKYIYAVATVTRVGGTERQAGLWICRDKTNPKETQNGYRLRVEKKAGANEVKYIIERVTAGAATEIKSFTSTEHIAGSRHALVLTPTGLVQLWLSKEEGSAFEEKASVEDKTYSEGYSGIYGKGAGEYIFKDFKTGTFVLGEKFRQFSKAPESKIDANIGLLKEGDHTVLAIVKYEEDGNILKPLTGAGAEAGGPELWINLGNFLAWTGEKGTPPFMQPPKGTWSLIGGTKVAGTAPVRLHMYDFTAKTWIHGNNTNGNRGEGAKANWGKFRLGGKINAVGPYKGGIQCIAHWPKVLTDEQFENLVKAASLGAWFNLEPCPPDIMWWFRQGLVTEAVEDVVDGATQIERVETTIGENPPIPYGTPERTLKVTPAGLVTFSAPVPASAGPQLIIPVPKAPLLTASAASPIVATGPTPSPTDHKQGLALPYPNIIANPDRLGPPRFTDAEKKALGL